MNQYLDMCTTHVVPTVHVVVFRSTFTVVELKTRVHDMCIHVHMYYSTTCMHTCTIQRALK
jgi:hypothetical protein